MKKNSVENKATETLNDLLKKRDELLHFVTNKVKTTLVFDKNTEASLMELIKTVARYNDQIYTIEKLLEK